MKPDIKTLPKIYVKDGEKFSTLYDLLYYTCHMYHANPQKYKENDNPHPFRKQISSSEIWLKDERKLQAAKENGFEVLIIWDSEFRRKTKDTKELIIKKCINFIKNN